MLSSTHYSIPYVYKPYISCKVFAYLFVVSWFCHCHCRPLYLIFTLASVTTMAVCKCPCLSLEMQPLRSYQSYSSMQPSWISERLLMLHVPHSARELVIIVQSQLQCLAPCSWYWTHVLYQKASLWWEEEVKIIQHTPYLGPLNSLLVMGTAAAQVTIQSITDKGQPPSTCDQLSWLDACTNTPV